MTFADRVKQWLGAPGGAAAAVAGAGVTPIAACEPRARVHVGGVVERTGTDPRTGWFEVTIRDTTGTLTLIWMGRDGITALVEGDGVVASGRLAERDGKRVLYHPAFSVLPA
ncbi:MAG: OB-fold nucleic acid binding domain-containing protein [Propionibacterium sp.]|nr:OB-fold nucleic acid binding domain-containing protein [Propionibacterium sp.]